jgi:hypothetical protein
MFSLRRSSTANAPLPMSLPRRGATTRPDALLRPPNDAAKSDGTRNGDDRSIFRLEHERQRATAALAHNDANTALAGLMLCRTWPPKCAPLTWANPSAVIGGPTNQLESLVGFLVRQTGNLH